MSALHIRKLTDSDAGAYREIRMEMCASHPEAFGQTPEEVAEMPDDKFVEFMSASDVFPERFILACFAGNRIIGTVAFRRFNLRKESHRGWIWSVYVRPEGRGKGISRQLMQQVIDEAGCMNGLELLTLTVTVTQTSARAVYGSLGFVTTGLSPQYFRLADGRYVDCEEMMLRLRK